MNARTFACIIYKNNIIVSKKQKWKRDERIKKGGGGDGDGGVALKC